MIRRVFNAKNVATLARTAKTSNSTSAIAAAKPTQMGSRFAAFHTSGRQFQNPSDVLEQTLKEKGIPIPEKLPPSEEQLKKNFAAVDALVIPGPDGELPIAPHVIDLAERLFKLNLIEANQLSKYMSQKLGIPLGGMPMGAPMMGAMPTGGVAAAAPGAAAAAAKPAEKPVEKTEFNVKLEKFDDKQKIKLIKEVRVVNKELGLKEAKDLVEGAPCIVMKKVKKEDADKIKAQLEAVGATVTLE
eukprot:GEZU01010124.1.p1 GENE.GEZU01010124.1~~GEZU01010124.1.p1  ORF type:complete len:261 (-),score=82.60 GEZU01010124.1:114-845(-)